MESADAPVAKPLALCVAGALARFPASALDLNPADAAEWARAAARTSVEHEGTFTASELRLLAAAATPRALAGT